MKKSQKSSKITQKLAQNKALLNLYLMVLILFGVVVIMGSVFWNMRVRSDNDFSVVRGLIIKAVEDLYMPTIVDPKEKKQYIYEASVRFPVSTAFNNFRYYHIAADANTPSSEEISIATNNSIWVGVGRLNSGISLFDQVPDFQRCSKEFTIRFVNSADIDPDFNLVNTKLLADGRTAYLYKNSSCNDFYAGAVDVDAHHTILEAIESY
jgi:hypothetical protein